MPTNRAEQREQKSYRKQGVSVSRQELVETGTKAATIQAVVSLFNIIRLCTYRKDITMHKFRTVKTAEIKELLDRVHAIAEFRSQKDADLLMHLTNVLESKLATWNQESIAYFNLGKDTQK